MGAVTGPATQDDTSAYAAEAWAVHRAVSALHTAVHAALPVEAERRRTAYVLLDCRSLLTTILRREPPLAYYEPVEEVRGYVEGCRSRGTDVVWGWAPSHGRQVTGWNPPFGMREDRLRGVNAAADAAARAARDRIAGTARRATWTRQRAELGAWAGRALCLAAEVQPCFEHHVAMQVRERAAGPIGPAASAAA